MWLPTNLACLLSPSPSTDAVRPPSLAPRQKYRIRSLRTLAVAFTAAGPRPSVHPRQRKATTKRTTQHRTTPARATTYATTPDQAAKVTQRATPKSKARQAPDTVSEPHNPTAGSTAREPRVGPLVSKRQTSRLHDRQSLAWQVRAVSPSHPALLADHHLFGQSPQTEVLESTIGWLHRWSALLCYTCSCVACG